MRIITGTIWTKSKNILFGVEACHLSADVLENTRKEYDDETIKDLFRSLNNQNPLPIIRCDQIDR